MEIEVKKDDFFFNAFVHNISDTQFEVIYENDLFDMEWVDFKQCRTIDKNNKHPSIKIGDVVYAFVCYQDDKKAWCKMKIQDIKNRHVVVEGIEDQTKTETIPIYNCRHPNIYIEISDSLIQTRVFQSDFFKCFDEDGQRYKILHELVPGIWIKSDKVNKELIIKALTKETIKMVDIGMDLILEDSRQDMLLTQQKEEQKKQVAGGSNVVPSLYFKFNVLSDIINIGFSDDEDKFALKIKEITLNRLEAARNLDGIKGITFDDSECDIFADTTEAAEKARAMLEIIHKQKLIPDKVVYQIIGKNRWNIKNIKQKSGVLWIFMGDKNLDDHVPFTFVGHSDTLKLAILMFNIRLMLLSVPVDFEPYSPEEFLKKAYVYYNMSPRDLIQTSHKLWSGCVYCVKKLFLVFGLCIDSHITLSIFCNYSLDVSTINPIIKGKLREGWKCGAKLHSFSYGKTQLRQSTFDHYMDRSVFFINNFKRITPEHVSPYLSEFLDTRDGFDTRPEDGEYKIGEVTYKYGTIVYTE